MTITDSEIQSKVQQWIADYSEAEKITKELTALGYDEETIEAHLKAFNKEKRSKTVSRAMLFVGIGALLGFLSCVNSIINPFPSLYFPILYGVTSISVLLVFYGLYLIFE